MKRRKHDRDRAQRNTRWPQPNIVSSNFPHETVHPARPGVIGTCTLGKPKSITGQTAEWTAWQFTYKASRVRSASEDAGCLRPCYTERLRSGGKQQHDSGVAITEHTVVLHARDDAQRSSSGDCTELSRTQWCISVAQVVLGVRAGCWYQIRSDAAVLTEATISGT